MFLNTLSSALILRDGKDFSPIIGFFIHAAPSEVIVCRWDQQQERLVKVSEEEEERYCQAVKSLEFDRQLGRYNLSQYGDWKHLLNYITKSIMEWIEPIGGEITVACESGIVTNTPKTAMEKTLDEQMKSSKFLTSVDNLGWEFQLNSAVDGKYFEEDDKFAPVEEMLDDPSCN